jgi:hypothetical protein
MELEAGGVGVVQDAEQIGTDGVAVGRCGRD